MRALSRRIPDLSRRACALNRFRPRPFPVEIGDLVLIKSPRITVKMAYNYVVTAHKPTAVNACVTGKCSLHPQMMKSRLNFLCFTVWNLHRMSHSFCNSECVWMPVPCRSFNAFYTPRWASIWAENYALYISYLSLKFCCTCHLLIASLWLRLIRPCGWSHGTRGCSIVLTAHMQLC